MSSTGALVNSDANTKRIHYVEQCFGNSGVPLAIPGRVLVGEGVLTKMCRKKPKPRQFFLFNDILTYGNILISKKKPKTAQKFHRKMATAQELVGYNTQHILPLEDVKLQAVQDEGNLRNGWQIISPKKSFTVYAATATEKSEWMAHINKCVQDLLAKSGKTRTDSADAPNWVPDSEATMCMHCKKTQFNVINRRHHCRKCGIVCCNSCSNKRWLMPQQASKPLRVCLSCYDVLAAEASGLTTPDGYNDNAGSQDSSGEDSSDGEDNVDSSPVSDNANTTEPTFYEEKKQ